MQNYLSECRLQCKPVNPDVPDPNFCATIQAKIDLAFSNFDGSQDVSILDDLRAYLFDYATTTLNFRFDDQQNENSILEEYIGYLIEDNFNLLKNAVPTVTQEKQTSFNLLLVQVQTKLAAFHSLLKNFEYVNDPSVQNVYVIRLYHQYQQRAQNEIQPFSENATGFIEYFKATDHIQALCHEYYYTARASQELEKRFD